MINVEVHICRIHKASPYNVKDVIPELKVNDIDDAIDTPEVQEVINKVFGKKLIVQVYPDDLSRYLEYEVTKTRAIL